MSSPLRVLIIGVSENETVTIIRELQRGCFEPIFERITTKEAMIAAIETQSWDVILSDYDMPDFNVPEALQLVKDRGLDLPFILVSGRIGEELAVEVLKAGAHDYIMKDRLHRLVLAVKRELLEAEERRSKKQAERALQGQLQFLETLINTIPSPVFYEDKNAVYRGCNKAFEEFFGLSSEDILGKVVHQLAPLETAEILHQLDIKLLQEPGTQSFESLVHLPNGTTREVLFKKATFLNADGEVEGLIGVIIDLTEHKRTKKSIQQLLHQNQMILNAAGEGIIGLDKEGQITFANPAAAAMTGYTLNELIGMDGHQNLHHSKANGTPYLLNECPMYKALRAATVKRVKDDVFWRKDGSSFAVAYSSTPIIETDEVIGAVITFMDITEIKRAEEALRLSEIEREKEHLKTVNLQSLSYLAGGIAHDFNNFLAAILGNLSLALIKTEVKEDIYQILLQAEQATLKARSLAQQLLTFSKGGVPDKKIIAFPAIIKQAADFVCIGSPSRCELAIADDLWALEADPDQLNQVMYHLMINSVQAMPMGGVIKVGAENFILTADSELPLSGGRYVRIYVQDQGIGIAEGNLSKIFDPYFTTQKQGTGLGLSTVYSIIKKHGGYISVTSKVDLGTTFYIYLPASEKEVTSRQDSPSALVTGKGRILIMDDEEIVRTTIAKMVTYLGYEVEVANDGAEALELYQKARNRQQSFDAVIMDLSVPGGMGGKDAMARLLVIDPTVKGIVSSGYSDDPVIANYKEYGFCQSIKKPYRIATLSKVLAKCLQKHA